MILLKPAFVTDILRYQAKQVCWNSIGDSIKYNDDRDGELTYTEAKESAISDIKCLNSSISVRKRNGGFCGELRC